MRISFFKHQSKNKHKNQKSNKSNDDFDFYYGVVMSHSKAEDDLKLGSITEVWSSRDQWLKYCQYLDKMTPEGYDSEGVPIKLSRYAIFLKVCILVSIKLSFKVGEFIWSFYSHCKVHVGAWTIIVIYYRMGRMYWNDFRKL